MNVTGFIVLYIVLSFLDLMTTVIGLNQGLPEGNPIAAWFFSEFGFAGLGLYKTINVAAMCFLASSYWHLTWARYLAYGAVFVLWLAVVHNIASISQ